MSDIKKELEKQFRAHGLLADDKSADKAGAEDVAIAPATEETVTVCFTAPKGYSPEFAEDFKNLSPEWQRFLTKHEAEVDAERQSFAKTMQELQWLHDVEPIGLQRQQYEGFASLGDWLKGLVELDEAMHTHPRETLKAIATVFNVDVDFEKAPHKETSDKILGRLCRLEENFHHMNTYLQQSNNRIIGEKLREFGAQTDDAGRSLHPYFYAVLPQMQALLQSGLVGDVSTAYKHAVWMNPAVRRDLIDKKIKSDAVEARKAKKAAFSPKGKAKAPQRELTLREELEKNMAAYLD